MFFHSDMEPPECMTILHSLAEEGKKYTVPVRQSVFPFLSLWINGVYQGHPEPNFQFRKNRTSLEYRVKAFSSNLQSYCQGNGTDHECVFRRE